MKGLYKLLNIQAGEWRRVFLMWNMMFLSRFGFIVGWSVLIATFLSRVGINYLPYLFLANAGMVMFGSFIYRKVLHRFSRELLIFLTVLFAAAFLLCSVLFIHTHTHFFFILLIIAESFFVAQLMILMSLFGEDLFTPLESQRTFPVIESAETLGGIAGGLCLSLLSTYFPPYKFVVLWALSLLLIIPVLVFSRVVRPNLSTSEGKLAQPKKKKVFSLMSKKVPFIKGLMVIVLLHWSILNIVEFQYTKAIQQDVYAVQEETLVHHSEEDDSGVVLASEGYTEAQIEDYGMLLAKKLGLLHALFNAGALLIQLILASRIMTRIGVVSTILIHPIVTLLNMIGLTLKFSLPTAVLARGSYELTGLMLKSAHDSSYYAVPHDFREELKELSQGLMKPIGAILGTLCILIVAFSFKDIYQTFALNLLLIVFGLTMAVVVSLLWKPYSALSEMNLSKRNDLTTRLNAIEIFAQNGHEEFPRSLFKLLQRDQEEACLKVKILETLACRTEREAIVFILDATDDPDESVRKAAFKALSAYKNTKLKAQPFSYFRLMDILKSTLAEDESVLVRNEALQLFHRLAPEQLSAFLVESIRVKSSSRPNFIRMLKVFKDSNLKHYLDPFLKGKSSLTKVACIEVLWQFDELRTELRHHLDRLLKSKNPSIKKDATHVAKLVGHSI